ncbi:MAG: PspC domain-containing protein [Actinomycetota bacterium]|nr:PspC domain-containing protein [Actinomycetota bacterium]
MSEINVEHTVRDFWATRPDRRAGDRKVAGVAAAIGRRYAIDPVLVRVAFVIATLFSGVGVLLYLLGWLLLPAEGDQVSTAESVLGRGRSSTSVLLTIVLVLLLLLATAAVFEDASGVLGLVVALGVLVLLHRSRGAMGTAQPQVAPSQADLSPRTAEEAHATPDPATSDSSTAPQSAPPAWDPLGAAPFAWDLPEPSAAPAANPPPRGPSSKVTPITLGLALLAGGIALAFWPALPAAHIAALMLGVVGLGLVVGSLIRGGRGLILVAVPLAVITWLLQAAPVSDFRAGERRWNPPTVAQVLPHYELGMGEGRLDLTDLTLTDGQTVTTSVVMGAGETRVILPPNVDAQVTCQAQFGDVECLDETDVGSAARVDVTDHGEDGPGGGLIKLNVSSGFGHVEVERGL